MLRDRLMGPPVIRHSVYPNAIYTFGSTYTVSVSDVKDIIAAAGEVFPKVTVTRLRRQPGGTWQETSEEIDLDNVSDGDLRHFTITGEPIDGQPSTPYGRVSVRLGSTIEPHVTVEHTPQPGETASEIDKLADRIEFIVTTNGRRQIPAWKWAEHLRLLGWLLAVVVWGVVTVTTWPGLHWSVVAAAALTAFCWQANAQAKAADKVRASELLVAPGRVQVDATDRDQLRIKRSQEHFTAKATAWGVLGAIAAAALGAWLQWFFGAPR